ncbi:MAG: S1C family serine protease [Planctomycetota bacterium]
MSGRPASGGAAPLVTWRTAILFAGFVALVGLIAWPSLAGRIQYARTRAELAAIADAAADARLAPVAKLFTTLARLIGPSVVNVTADRRLATIADEIATLHGHPTGGIDDESVGSGVIIGADGVIVTNYHVVARADRITVTLADGREFTARLVAADAATDLAVLEIEAQGLPAAAWGDSDELEVGEMVWAIGNPFGLDRTLTYGIISAKGRLGVAGDPLQEFLQTDAAINPGNSGGPLVDVNGRVVGITTAIASPDSRGIGFAIPSNTARQVATALERLGHVERGYLGLALRDTEDGSPGALVVATERASPGDESGIRPGDVVVAFAGEEIEHATQLFLAVTRAEVGAEVPLEVLRAGKRIPLTTKIGRRPR